ncbi:glucose-1-phosphate adenylyltransferase [Bacillus alkalicellulosilyticus]|uniref:glucose-1-phosphate adenylyltransferase n=1 Tax=Alkalihalobacterium alkalicellulosilyticum TaxID=1912214 RepID=UPI00099635BC|nr:glucose-1-phosphate adenylyltransferase [Bacillus alkalicellulosilyticus]
MNKECVGMLLAGGEGKRLGLLTQNLAKPAVHFGGKYRIIDFTLSNCTNSGIDTVGVLTQYEPLALNTHLGNGAPWDLDRRNGGISILPPFSAKKGASWYQGTADAIYQNINFIEQFNPEYVLVISGDHIYKMNYAAMLDFHKKQEADATISVIQVPWEEASRFGILNTAPDYSVLDFDEKPANPKNNLASMGIYIFNWKVLKSYLQNDAKSNLSSHDFGKDILPSMLGDHRKMVAFPFRGYWKDVGTIKSYWEANMDLLREKPSLQLTDYNWRIYSVNPNQPPQYLSPASSVTDSLINEGCFIEGNVMNSVLFHGVTLQENSIISNSVIMPNVKIGKNVVIDRAIISEGTIIPDDVSIKPTDPNEIIVLDKDSIIADYAIAN